MKIKVTAQHIQEGQPRGSRNCPVALALNEVLYDRYYASVGRSTYSIFLDAGLHTYVAYRGNLPWGLRLFIDSYDSELLHTNEIEADVAIPVGYIKYPRREY